MSMSCKAGTGLWFAACVTAMAAGPAQAQGTLSYSGITVDGSGEKPSVCLRFSEKLNQAPEAHYSDYLTVSPAAQFAAHVEGNRLCVDGLAAGHRYNISIKAGLMASAGQKTAGPVAVTANVPDRDPLVAIGGQGWILSRATASGLTIQTVNVRRVHVRVFRMSERLLSMKLPKTEQYGRGIDLKQQTFSIYDLRRLLQADAAQIWSGTMDTRPGDTRPGDTRPGDTGPGDTRMGAAAERNSTIETAFPLASVIKPGETGAYLVIAENADRKAAILTPKPDGDDSEYDSEIYDNIIAGHWLIATETGLSTWQGEDGLTVVARSLADASPRAGVTLQILSRGQDLLAVATTDKAGKAHFAAPLLAGTGASAPAVLMAYGAKGDIAVQDLEAQPFDLSDRGVSGRTPSGPLEAFIYADRGIYRPGETIHATALLRRHSLDAADRTPLTLVLRRPNGMEARRVTLAAKDGQAAGFQQDFTLPDPASHGDWTIEALTDPSRPPVGTLSVQVRDFVPQTLAVTLEGADKPVAPGAHIVGSLSGRFLYGAPAAGLHAEGRLEIAADPEPIPGLKGWRFGLVDETIPQDTAPFELPDADAQGHVAIDIAPKLPDGIASPLRATLVAGLTEPSGRVVEDRRIVKLRAKPLLIGLLPLFTGDQVAENAAARFRLATYSPDGKPVAHAGLHWTLVREERHWDWFRDQGSRWSFHYHTVDQTVASGRVDSGADGKTELGQAVEWGTYRLVVSDEASGSATSIRFSSGWQSTTDMNADSPDKLPVSADKTALKPGETAKLHIEAPFAGRAQIVIANSRVLETRDVDVPAGGLTIDVKATSEWGAGAYVMATLYRPLEQKRRAHDPVRAVGLTWIGTDTAPHRLAVALKVPLQILPRQHLSVPVHVTAADGTVPQSVFVTMAAVDEGILQITKFRSPDPLGTLAGKQKLGVSMRDDYGRLLDDGARAGAVHEGGGGGEDDMGGAALPVRSSRTVALFKAPVAVDAKGDAAVEMDVPDFEGELRLMAVAYDAHGLGHADAPVTVRDPVVVTLALPRFLAPGDVAHPVLQLHDVDGPAGRYAVQVTTQGPGSVTAPHVLEYDLKSGQRVADPVTLAANGAGVLTLVTDVTGPGGFHVTHHDEIAVREPHFPYSIAQTAVQAPGEEWHYDPAAQKSFAPGSVSAAIGYNRFGGIDVAGLLQSLYRYPYGCTEQMSSSAFPLIYFNDPSLIGKGAQDKAVAGRVQRAVDTILDRQDSSGRFGLWRVGDGDASPWLNVYAMDFLLHARDAGFDVPDGAIRRGLSYVQMAIANAESDNSGSYRAGIEATRAYGLYVLARSGHADISLLRRVSDSISWSGGASVEPASVRFEDGRQASALALGQLAGAASLMGDAGLAKQLFRLAAANVRQHDVPNEWLGAFYYTPLRDMAGLVAIAAETRNDDVVSTLMESLQAQSLQPESLNTQEKAWLLMAAHALQNGMALKDGPLLTVNGAARQGAVPLALTPGPEQLNSSYTVRNDSGVRLFRTVTLTGTPKSPPKAMEAGYTLSRTLLNTDGSPVDPKRLRQNDRLLVVLSGTVADNGDHQTVLADMLPAGWEIEAPVTDVAGRDFLKALTPLRSWQARDDRFVAAFAIGPNSNGHGRYEDVDDNKPHLEENEFRIAYMVRLVTPGQFARPEAIVEDMYRPALMGRTESGSTIVDAR